MDSTERRRIVAEIRERAAEAAIAPSVPDDKWELAALGIALDDEHEALQRLGDTDPLGVGMFGDHPGWIDSHVSRNTPPK
jgi:hypothetical protein